MSVKAKIHDTHTILPQERMCENSCKGDVTLNTKLSTNKFLCNLI